MENLTRIKVGEWGQAVMPCSEVCMHMHIADRVMDFQVISERAVQLYIPAYAAQNHGDRRMFSSPILTGEAGIYHDSEGMYYYKATLNDRLITVKLG